MSEETTEFLGGLKHRQETTPSCDHTSVGVIAHDSEGRILLIERRKFPFGWAPPSGHCDGLDYPVACFKEFQEETGLSVVGAPKPTIPKNPRKNYACRRGGQYHHWQIFEVNWRGDLKPSDSETKNARWCSISEIITLGIKTEKYLKELKLACGLQEELEVSMVKLIEREWQASPGLEPVWCEFFKELDIIPEMLHE